MAILIQTGAVFNAPGATAPIPCVLGVFHVNRSSGGKPVRISHSYWAFDYAMTDCGAYKTHSLRGPWRKRRAGTAHLYAPGVPYWENFSGTGRRRRSAFIVFSGGENAGLLRLTEPSGGFARFEDPEGLLASLLIEAARIAADLQANAFYKTQSLLFSLVDTLHQAKPAGTEKGLWRIAGSTPVAASAESSIFSKKVHAFLADHLAQNLTLQTIAGRFGVSPSSLSHRFQTETGESPMQTLRQIRMERAKGLLLKGEPLKNIAPLTGFCDEYHLSKAFKSLTGVSPRAFQRGATEVSRDT